MTVASKAQTATVFDFKLLFTGLTFTVWHGFPVYLSLCITILSNCCFRGLELSASQLQAIDVDKYVPANLFNCLTCCSSSLCGVNRCIPRPLGASIFMGWSCWQDSRRFYSRSLSRGNSDNHQRSVQIWLMCVTRSFLSVTVSQCRTDRSMVRDGQETLCASANILCPVMPVVSDNATECLLETCLTGKDRKTLSVRR